MASSALSLNHRNGLIFCITSPFGLRFSVKFPATWMAAYALSSGIALQESLRTTFSAGRRVLSPGESRWYQLCISFLILREARDLQHRPDLDGTHTRYWDPFSDTHRLVEIPGLDQVVTTQLFARLRKRTVCHDAFAFAHPDAGRRRSRV